MKTKQELKEMADDIVSHYGKGYLAIWLLHDAVLAGRTVYLSVNGQKATEVSDERLKMIADCTPYPSHSIELVNRFPFGVDAFRHIDKKEAEWVTILNHFKNEFYTFLIL